MAKRRMLSIPIVETDRFYTLSAAAQAFYLHLNLNADDDGVVDKVNLIMSQMRLKRKCFAELCEAGYILELEDGLIAITHWHQHNQIRKERYVKGEYLDRLSSLSLQENGRFIKASATVLGDKCVTQDSIGKDSIDKYSTDKGSRDQGSIAEHSRGEERKGDNNFSLSYIHSTPASQEAANKSDIPDLTLDPLTLQALKNNIRLYFMKKYQTVDTFGFIEHHEANNWLTEDGKPIVESYKYYIDEWMKAFA